MFGFLKFLFGFLKFLFRMMGVGEVRERKTVETIPGGIMLPTASGNDDGKGWKYTADGWQREVKVGARPTEPGNWNEGSPGVWHKSD